MIKSHAVGVRAKKIFTDKKKTGHTPSLRIIIFENITYYSTTGPKGTNFLPSSVSVKLLKFLMKDSANCLALAA